jgi:hypothetical protein
VVARQDIGALGPAQGSPVTADCPLADSLRGVFVWFFLFALLLRKVNRNRQAWALVLALGAISLLLHVAQSYITAHITFYLHRHICTIICELLQTLASAMAVLLALADLITLRSRLLRFGLVFLILLAAGVVAIVPNAPIVLSPAVWIAVFGFFLFVFLLGHAILRTLLKWLVGPRGLAWNAGIALLLGLAPVVAFAVIGLILNRSLQLQSTIISFRFATTVAEAVLGPYFVLFWFLLLALWVPLYRERLARAFGYTPVVGR